MNHWVTVVVWRSDRRRDPPASWQNESAGQGTSLSTGDGMPQTVTTPESGMLLRYSSAHWLSLSVCQGRWEKQESSVGDEGKGGYRCGRGNSPTRQYNSHNPTLVHIGPG